VVYVICASAAVSAIDLRGMLVISGPADVLSIGSKYSLQFRCFCIDRESVNIFA